MFEYDDKAWKINAKLIKDPLDLMKTQDLIKENLRYLKDVYLDIQVNSTYPFINMVDFAAFC